MKPVLRLLFFSSLLLLNACAHRQQAKKPARDSFQTTIWDSEVLSWSIKGKLSIKSDIEKGSGRFIWTSNNSLINAKFSAPLGQGSWEIKEYTDHSELISSKSGTTHAQNTQILLHNELGWEFPWNKLPNWLRGYKSTANPSQNAASFKNFTEDGWLIEYLKTTATEYGQLPKLIKASQNQYEIKVVIHQWNINDN